MVNVFILSSSQNFSFHFRGVFADIYRTFLGGDIVFLSDSSLFFFTKSSYFRFLSAYYYSSVGAEYGFFLELRLVGLGFRYIKFGDDLLLRLGHSHYIRFKLSLAHSIGYRKRLLIFGPDYSDLMQIAATLRFFRKPDVYKNKGIQILGTSMRLKAGKKK